MKTASGIVLTHIVVLCLSLWAPVSNAADIVSTAPLAVEVDVTSSINRSGGPIPLTLHVHYYGSQAGLAGDLTLRLVTTDGTPMATYLLEGLFIPKGEQTYEFLIQPPTSDVWQEGYDLFPIFRTDKGKVYHLQEQLLRLPGASRRSCVITVASDEDGILQQSEKSAVGELAFESRMPGFENIRPANRPVSTLFRAVDIQNFPTQPLSHCVSDMVVLPDDTFARLSQKQITALLAWVKAGGSLFVFLDETEPLSGQRQAELNSFLNAAEDDPLVFQLSSGKVQFSNDADAPCVMRSLGLGRVAVTTSPGSQSLGNHLGESNLRRLYIHLWKVRAEQAQEILNSPEGNWSFAPGRRYTVMNNYNFSNVNDPGIDAFVRRFRPTPTPGGNALLENTLPQGMEMLPLWLIGVTLFFYILVIGPADYLLLGAFNLRKYTWIFFPVMTIIFTAGAIIAANSKMQGSNDGGRVLIRDISQDGHILRENEISTFVPTSAGEKLVNADKELLAPISPSRLGVDQHHYQQYRNYDYSGSPPVFRGRFPIEAQLVQRVHKWTPEMVRLLRIPAEPLKEESSFDWTRPIDPFSSQQRRDLANRLRSAFGSDVSAKLIRRDARNESKNSPGKRGPRQQDTFDVCGLQHVLMDEHTHIQRRMVGVNGNVWYDQNTYEPISFVDVSSFREEAGMYSIVSHLSPKCDDFLEDLPVLDPTDQNSWLLIVLVQQGNQWDVFRQLIQTKQ